MKTIGGYKILKEISSGSMGIIYKAYDDTLDRNVALKVMRQELLSNDLMKNRFKVEAKAAAMLNHPNVVTIYSFGEDDNKYYLVMEYIEGSNLKEYLTRYADMSITMKLEIIEQVLLGLTYAHKYNIVHRDIKPANIMILDDGNIKITDFGIAHLESTNLTRTGAMIGTPDYMSPEQVLSKKVDRRSDLFSIGVIMYQMISGRKPFLAKTVSAVLSKIANEEPPSFEALKINVPFEVESIILKALEKNPAKRYQSGEEILCDVKAALMILSDNEDRQILKKMMEVAFMIQEAKRLLKENRSSEAISALETAKRLEPNNKTIKELLDEAKIAYEKENELRVETVLKRAELVADIGDDERALKIARQSFVIENDNVKAITFIDKQLKKIQQKTGESVDEIQTRLSGETLIELNDTIESSYSVDPDERLFSSLRYHSPDVIEKLERLPGDLRGLILEADRIYYYRRNVIDDIFSINKLLKAHSINPKEFETSWRISRNYYDKGMLLTRTSEKKRAFNQGIYWGKIATELESGRSEGLYWFVVNMAKWGDVNGIFRGIVLVERLFKTLQQLIELDDHYAEGGAYRVMGRIKYRMPRVIGGSIEESIELLYKSLEICPRQPDTLLFLSESLMTDKKYDEARKHLNYLMEMEHLPHKRFETEFNRKIAEKHLLRLEKLSLKSQIF